MVVRKIPVNIEDFVGNVKKRVTGGMACVFGEYQGNKNKMT